MSMTVERETPTWLTVTMPFSKVTPEELLTWFLEPEKLAKWWAPQSVVEPHSGGKWHITFPQIESTLLGEIAELTPTRLTASWQFTHEPDLPARMVTITAEPIHTGAQLRIVHGPYRQGDAFPREDEDRASHIEGWGYFLPQLEAAIGAQTNVNA